MINRLVIILEGTGGCLLYEHPTLRNTLRYEHFEVLYQCNLNA